MSISRSSWDRWAPAAYLFVIGLALGLVIGFAVGATSGIGQGAAYFLLIPVAIIVVAFIVFAAIGRRVGPRP